jgi:glycosyltransferase involved in cell wall biosynthesis
MVDDGSDDETSAVFDAWTRESGFRGIQLSRNFGKEAAITAGLDATSGDAVVIMDADLQHDPALIPTMVARWQAGFDVVYAIREHRRDEGLLKRACARLFYRIVNIGSRFRIPPDAGDFRLMDRAVCAALRELPERTRFMKGLYAWVGFRSSEIAYTPARRNDGQSSFNLRRLTSLALDGVTSFTNWPLKLVSWVGFMVALAGMGYGAFLVVEHLRVGHEVPGWTTIVVAIMLFSGVQLIALGILGQYVGRIFLETKDRPAYVIRRQGGAGLADPGKS